MAGALAARVVAVDRVIRSGDFRQRKQNAYDMRELTGAGYAGLQKTPPLKRRATAAIEARAGLRKFVRRAKNKRGAKGSAPFSLVDGFKSLTSCSPMYRRNFRTCNRRHWAS